MFLPDKNGSDLVSHLALPGAKRSHGKEVLLSMGRPKKHSLERRDAKLDLRLKTAEKSHVEHQAAEAGMSAAEYGRNLILGRRVTATPTRADAALLFELNRIGVNLNQLTKAFNQGCDPDGLEAVADELRDTLQRIGAAYGA